MACAYSAGVRLPGSLFGIFSLTRSNNSESGRPVQAVSERSGGVGATRVTRHADGHVRLFTTRRLRRRIHTGHGRDRRSARLLTVIGGRSAARHATERPQSRRLWSSAPARPARFWCRIPQASDTLAVLGNLVETRTRGAIITGRRAPHTARFAARESPPPRPHTPSPSRCPGKRPAPESAFCRGRDRTAQSTPDDERIPGRLRPRRVKDGAEVLRRIGLEPAVLKHAHFGIHRPSQPATEVVAVEDGTAQAFGANKRQRRLRKHDVWDGSPPMRIPPTIVVSGTRDREHGRRERRRERRAAVEATSSTRSSAATRASAPWRRKTSGVRRRNR